MHLIFIVALVARSRVKPFESFLPIALSFRSNRSPRRQHQEKHHRPPGPRLPFLVGACTAGRGCPVDSRGAIHQSTRTPPPAPPPAHRRAQATCTRLHVVT